MSKKELDRVHIVRQVCDRSLTQKEGGAILGLSTRQVKRLCRRFRENGDAGLVSLRRGRPSGNRLDADLKSRAIALVQAHYADFGPTLACEMLQERHGVSISRESLRQIVIKEKLWRPRKARKSVLHPPRDRRPRYGELAQIDGSPHRWFEDRGAPCCLISVIDDATSAIQAARFVPVESTGAYMALVKEHFLRHGRPLAVYSDKHSIFQTAQPGHGNHDVGETQFARALRELDIELICAHSPQAKGRIERLFGTLQDRLVKELRLQGICDMDSANAFLPGYIEAHNQRFAVPPREKRSAYRPLLCSHNLEYILCSRQERCISKELTVSYQRNLYQILTSRPAYALRNRKVEVLEDNEGRVSFWLKGQELEFDLLKAAPKQGRTVDRKTLKAHLDAQTASVSGRKSRKPAPLPANAGFRLSVSRGFTPNPGI